MDVRQALWNAKLMDAVRKRIARAIKDRGLDMKAVSLEIGKNHAYMQQYLERGIPAKLREDVRSKLSELLDIPEEELGAPPKRIAGVDHQGDIPNFTIHAGMGPGGALSVMANDNGEIFSEYSDGFWSFPDAVKAGWRNMSKIYAMPVTGDSMEPTLPGGSFAFVDTSHTVPSPEDIYAIDYGDGLMIKRVKLVPRSEKILIMSDNERYGTDELHRQEVRVYGRVVAWFQWRG